MLAARHSADVAIAGGGLAGLAAALEALDRNRRVLLLDRDDEVNLGGLAKESFGGIWFAGSPLQRRRGIRDSVELGFGTSYEVEFGQQRLPALRDAFEAQLGRPIAVTIALDVQASAEKAARRSLVEVEEQAREAERMRRRREAMEHPSRALVRDVFGEVQFLEPSIELEVNAHG